MNVLKIEDKHVKGMKIMTYEFMLSSFPLKRGCNKSKFPFIASVLRTILI